MKQLFGDDSIDIQLKNQTPIGNQAPCNYFKERVESQDQKFTDKNTSSNLTSLFTITNDQKPLKSKTLSLLKKRDSNTINPF